jgi:hypothetical protein
MYSHAIAAQNIKKELSQNFLGIKFSVKSKSYSGGNSINIDWELGPTTEQVKAFTYKYEAGDFDGMTDCYNYSNDFKTRQFQEKNGSAKYIFCNRNIPDYVYEIIIKRLCEIQRIPFEGEIYNIWLMGRYASNWVHLIMAKADIPVGAVITGIEETNIKAGAWEDFFTVIYK